MIVQVPYLLRTWCHEAISNVQWKLRPFLLPIPSAIYRDRRVREDENDEHGKS